MRYPDIQIFLTRDRDKGKGVRATSVIKKDTMICEYIGNIMTRKEIKKEKLESNDSVYYLFKNK